MRWLKRAAGLVPDLPGFGDSAVPSGGSDADAVPEPLEQGLGILVGELACDLVGFSFGGMVAGFIAERFAPRAARVVLVGAPGLGVALEKAIRLRAWRHIADSGERDVIHRHNLAALMLYREEAITGLALRLHIANVLRDRMKGRSLARTDVLAQSLKRVRCPVSEIYGREDALYRGKLDLLQAALENALDFKGLALIEDAGHWVQFEQAGAFDKALLAALGAGL